jgi:hypothetical protein
MLFGCHFLGVLSGLVSILSAPDCYIQYQSKLYQVGRSPAKNVWSSWNSGALAVKQYDSGRIFLSMSNDSMGDNSYKRSHWSLSNGNLLYMQRNPIQIHHDLAELCIHSFSISQIPDMATFEDLEHFGSLPKFTDRRLILGNPMNCPKICSVSARLMYYFPDSYKLKMLGTVAVDFCMINDHTCCFYMKVNHGIHSYYVGPNDPCDRILRANDDSAWVYKRSIALDIDGDFYVYQTSRNALCLLDSNRQFYYIAPIGGGAMVKKVSKLDYPVKIVYSGKTIDIFAANVSYHLDEHGELSSPGKTVWPTPKK